MSNILVNKIKKQEQEIASLKLQKQEIENKIEKAISYLNGMEDAYKELTKKPVEITLREGTDIFKVRDLLLKVGHPLHIKDILKGMGKEVTSNTRVSLSGSINSYAKKSQIFIKTNPNTFGLIELQNKKETISLNDISAQNLEQPK